MKAFLISQSINQKQIDQFKKLLGQTKVSKALLITTAAVPYGFKPKPDWLEESLNAMYQFAKVIDETSLEDKKYIPEDLNQYDFIFVSGGNTFYLAYRLAQTGLDKKIKEYIDKGGIYSGSSAGAIILMNNIKYFSPADDPSKAPKIYPGLNLIDFAIIPHSDNKKYKSIMKSISENYKANGYDVSLLNDNQVMIINNESKEII